jgi:hypothetical protein
MPPFCFGGVIRPEKTMQISYFDGCRHLRQLRSFFWAAITTGAELKT